MEQAIATIRTFNRFFTRHVGAIDARFLDSDANLPEARLLFEIARLEPVLASTLQAELDLDRGYLSRMIARFEKKDWIVRDQETADARARPIRLTTVGRAAFDQIDSRQRAVVAQDLDRLDSVEQQDLLQALTRARLLLDPASGGPFTIRPFRTGEVSQVVTRQSIFYAASHGWGRPLETLEAETVAAFLRDFKPDREQCWIAEIDGVMAGALPHPFRPGGVSRVVPRQSIFYAASHGWGRPLETLEAETVAAFLRDFKPDREQCWIAEIDGVMAGAIFLTDEGNGLARLRLLHVEPFARRRGIGDALVATCLQFARDKHYRAVTLWTHKILEPARRIYARHGFVCVSSDVHTVFGDPIEGETWRVALLP
nr:MarR family transcriptional regulator [Sphingobium yanoikuyae]